MRDYHAVHLKSNVLLLTIVLLADDENFRNSSLKNYRLCLSHYLSAPDLKLGCNTQFDKS